MKILYPLFLIVIIISCSNPQESEITGPPTPVNPPVVVEDIVVPKQNNVINISDWEIFETDIKMVFFYSKIDSLQQNQLEEKEICKTFCDANSIVYHEYYTNEDLGMVQLNDTMFFDLTECISSHEEGFLLLKPTVSVNITQKDDLAQMLTDFYK